MDKLGMSLDDIIKSQKKDKPKKQGKPMKGDKKGKKGSEQQRRKKVVEGVRKDQSAKRNDKFMKNRGLNIKSDKPKIKKNGGDGPVKKNRPTTPKKNSIMARVGGKDFAGKKKVRMPEKKKSPAKGDGKSLSITIINDANKGKGGGLPKGGSLSDRYASLH